MEDNNTTPVPSGGNGGKTAGIVIAIVILAGLGWYFASGKFGNNLKSENNSASQNSTLDLRSQPTTLKEILALEKTQVCDVSFIAQDLQNKATIYLSGKRMRADYFAKINDKEVSSHIINDGKYLYTWADGTTVGVKFSADVNENLGNENKDSIPSIDPDEKYTFNCKPWVAIETLLNSPSNISFTDMSGITKTKAPITPVSGLTAEEKARRCAVCDSSPEDVKSQCRQALSCQ